MPSVDTTRDQGPLRAGYWADSAVSAVCGVTFEGMCLYRSVDTRCVAQPRLLVLVPGLELGSSALSSLLLRRPQADGTFTKYANNQQSEQPGPPQYLLELQTNLREV